MQANKPWEVIKLLESDNSRLFKEDVISREANSNNHDFFEGLRYCLDNSMTYGIKKIPLSTEDGSGLDMGDFSIFVRDFEDRVLTGNNAKKTIETLIKLATKDQWNYWYRRILLKDLKCGVSVKTVNNVLKKLKRDDYVIPFFSCQLAWDANEHPKKLKGNKIIDVKLNGVRVLTFVYPDGTVKQFSREGKELHNFPKIKEQFALLAKQWNGNAGLVFDGEVMSATFQDLMTQLRRKEDVQTDDATLHLFDFIYMEDFEKGIWEIDQIGRRVHLENLIEPFQYLMPNVKIIGHELVNLDEEDGQKRFKEINNFAVSNGYEGIMIKDPDAPYECKRTASWLKMKPFITVDLTIEDVIEGDEERKYVGMMGAILCTGTDQGKQIEVKVGTGFDDAKRKEYWQRKEELIGRTVEIKGDEFTIAQNSEVYSLRFPVFLGFRNDK